MLIAKHESKNGKSYFQTLEGHSKDCLNILKCYIERNQEVIKQFCERWCLDYENFLKNLFITVYLHDIGKATEHFQRNIKAGKHSLRYPHSFFAFPIFLNLYLSGILTPLLRGSKPIPIELCSVLGHHTQLYKNIYEDVYSKVEYCGKDILDFINSSGDIYNKLGFDDLFKLNMELESYRFLDLDANKIEGRLKEIIYVCSNYEDKIKLKSIFSFFHSVLQLCDDYASVNFAEHVKEYDGEEYLFGSVLEDPERFVLTIPDISKDKILGGNEPYAFQDEIFDNPSAYSLLFAPCGRGKTEAALLWALEVCKRYKKSKIIFAMPTQITSNAMRDRFSEVFGEENVGLFHGKSFIKLKGEKKEQLEVDELTPEDLDEIKGENFKGNVFFKPITVTTIDHLIYAFVHGFRQADFALGNLQNAVIIFDEAHYYEKQTLEHLVTLFKILKKMQIPHLLMSGTLPDFFIEKIKEIWEEGKSDYKLIKDEEGLDFEPFKIVVCEESLITKERVNDEVIDEIVNNYKKGLNQFVILNTVRRSQEFYRRIRKRLEMIEDNPNIVLHHSQFTYRDRNKKEEQIMDKKEERPFILVATQVIEISLDISCDRMYTELAPADALGQRGGRLNRKGRTWKTNGTEHVMRIFLPENERPYESWQLDRTKENLKNSEYSYSKLKQICDRVYYDYKLNDTELKTRFEECTLFGWSPSDMTFGTEEDGKLLKIREEKMQKMDVVPWGYYKGEERNLVVENQAKIPLWWYKQDQEEHGEEVRCFELIYKPNGRKEKPYWVCKIPYNKHIGFEYNRVDECDFSEENII